MAKKRCKKHKKKINKRRILIFLAIVLFIVFFFYKLFTVNISNIYIKGNKYFSDQKIIDIAGLNNYPNSLENLSYLIEDKLKKNKYILSSKVHKNIFLNKVYISIKENYPLFYYKIEDKTVLYNGDKVDDKFISTVVINNIPNTIYDKFLKSMEELNLDILTRISEIEYKPNDVDQERFFLIMNDGNYVYLTLYKFNNMNKYLNIIKTFENKKGILYLDSGEYFDVFDEN